MRNHILSGLAALCLAAPTTFLVAPVARAQAVGDIVRLDVLPGWETAEGTRMAAVRLTLAPGWKTYWRAPGDAGIPPLFDWSGSENLAAVALHWPVPQVFVLNGMRSIGYSGQVTLPIELTAPAGTRTGRLAGTVEIGVCDEICMPVRLSFAVELPQGGRRDPAIVAALVDRPLTEAEAGVGPVTCSIVPAGEDGLRLVASVEMPPMPGGENVAIEAGDAEVWVSEPEVRREGGLLVAEADMVHVVGGAGFAVDRSAIRITVIGDGSAVDIRGCGAG